MDSSVVLFAASLLAGCVVGYLLGRARNVGENAFRIAQESAKVDLYGQQNAIANLVAPMRENLNKLETFIQRSENERKAEFGSLFTQLAAVAETNMRVEAQASELKSVLRTSSSARGRWGEVQLRRVVELAGMIQHSDFVEQTAGIVSDDQTRGRADLVVFMPGDVKIPIDSKVPYDAYERAQSCTEQDLRASLMRQHARAFRNHVDDLIRREYWNQYQPGCGFTVMFVPGESLLDEALVADSSLWEHAASNNILLATPTTLIALLRMAALGWRQLDQNANAMEIARAGQELHRRILKLSEHLEKVGKALRNAVSSYNDFVGSYDSRLVPAARRMSELGVVDHCATRVVDVAQVGELPRSVHADSD